MTTDDMRVQFHRGRIVVVNGNLYKGLGQVEGLDTDVTEKEAGEPVPLLAVWCGDGRTIIYNADEIRNRVVRPATPEEAAVWVSPAPDGC